MKNNLSLSDTSNLRELMLSNPELPLLFFCTEDCNSSFYGYEQAFCNSCRIEELCLYEDQWLDKEAYKDKLYDVFADAKKYKDLTGDEYDKIIDSKVKDTEFTKAIAIYLG